MLCQKCGDFEFYFDLEDYFCKSILFEPLNYFSGVAVENTGETNLICDECGEEILAGDLYLEDESAVERTKELVCSELAKVVMRNIEACEECGHGEHMRQLHHCIESTFDEEDDNPEEIFSRFHKSTELGELIWDVTGFDDAYYEDIVKYIHCPHCMNGNGTSHEDKTDHGHFDLSSEVYTKEDITYFENKLYSEAYEEIKHEILRIADVCSYEELVELKEEFLRNPLLIASDAVFKNIFELIKRLYSQGNCLLLQKSKRVYRARANENTEPFSADKMWEAPRDKTRQNRYNMSGMPVLYCGNSEDFLHKEVSDTNGLGYTYAEMRLLRPFKMFKINAVFGYEFQGFIQEAVPKNYEDNEFKTQYILTNIMALITKKVGYDGIVYKSVKDNWYINYAFFNYKKDKDIEIIQMRKFKP